MDSSIENAKLQDELEEISAQDLLLAAVDARSESQAELFRHLYKQRCRKQQAAHERKQK